MLIVKTHQDNFKNSTELGPVIGETDKRLVEPWKVAVSWLLLAVLLGTILYFGKGELWGGVCSAILFSAIGVGIAVAKRLSGKTGNRVLRVHEKGLSLLQGKVSTETRYGEVEECCSPVVKVQAGAGVGDRVQSVACCKVAEGGKLLDCAGATPV